MPPAAEPGLPPLQARFHTLPAGGQRLWLLHTPPPGVGARGALLYVHPWAEEMNKSRRMAALAARALALDGWTVLQPDLGGCGDSGGDLRDASVDTWLDELQLAAQALRPHAPQGRLWLWGLRAGALWCCALAERLCREAPDAPAPGLLLWQPVAQGKAHLQQFLRLKAAAQLADGGGKGVVEGLRASLQGGQAVEVAGYEVGPPLARGFDAAALTPPPLGARAAAPALWLEVASGDEPALMPASLLAAPRWQQAGWTLAQAVVGGPAFWQTTEIEDAPALVQLTVEQMRAHG